MASSGGLGTSGRLSVGVPVSWQVQETPKISFESKMAMCSCQRKILSKELPINV